MYKGFYNHIPLGYTRKYKNGKIDKKFGIYKCIDCRKEFERQIYEAKKRDSYCKKCAAFHKSERKDKGTGASNTRIYKIHQKMKSRCNNKNDDAYKYYGARGIKISDCFSDFYFFRKWAFENGYDNSLTIDRINNYGNYEPDNCRWVDRKIQQRNQRKLRKNNTSGFRGVSNHQKGYIIQITVNNKSKYLGISKTAELGAIIYDAYVLMNNLEHTTNYNYPIGFIQEVDQVDFKTAVETVGGFVGVA